MNMGINETRYQVESVPVYRERSFGRARLIILANPLDSVAFDEDRSIWKETPLSTSTMVTEVTHLESSDGNLIIQCSSNNSQGPLERSAIVLKMDMSGVLCRVCLKALGLLFSQARLRAREERRSSGPRPRRRDVHLLCWGGSVGDV